LIAVATSIGSAGLVGRWSARRGSAPSQSRLPADRQLQQQMLEDAGHELRTPLTSLRTNIELLELHPEMPADVRSETVQALAGEVRELAALIEGLMQAWQLELAAEPAVLIRLDELVGEAVALTRRRTTRTIDLRAEATEVVGRPGALRAAVVNLIDNALKFDRSDRPIEVTVGPGSVWVRDHGPGIDPAHAEQIFQRFHRGPDTQSMPGSGLGLAIVAAAAKAHGGQASATNHRDGGALVGFTMVGARP
jgi:two-component system, OmpR family, sensor histidine kinase MprB